MRVRLMGAHEGLAHGAMRVWLMPRPCRLVCTLLPGIYVVRRV